MKTIYSNKPVVTQAVTLRALLIASLVLCAQWFAGTAFGQTCNSWPFLVSTNAYWNVTDITDPGQPVALGVLQAPFSKTNYLLGPGPNNAPTPPPANTPWHIDGSTIGNQLSQAFGTAPSGGYYSHGTVFAVIDNSLNLAPNQLILVGDVFYGTTYGWGYRSEGTVFRINKDGTGFKTLHVFKGYNGPPLGPHVFQGYDGANPMGALVFSGGVLYGTTTSGGVNGYGEVFSITTDGSVFKDMYDFQGGDDGAYPEAGLVLSGDTLYGTAAFGAYSHDYINGEYGDGVVFSVKTDGTAFSTIHTFHHDQASDGANPEAGLVMSGGLLYGTTSAGGLQGEGTVFSIDTVHGNTFEDLHDFTYSPSSNDGANPVAGLVILNGVLYGTTYNGGTNGSGMVFSCNSANKDYTNIWSFTGDPYGGDNPAAGLLLSGGVLYGTTSGGIWDFDNNVYSIDIANGNAFQVLHVFDKDTDGEEPAAGLVISGGVLYGATPNQGPDGFGTIFSINLNSYGYFTVLLPFPPSPVYAVTNIYSFSGTDRNEGSEPEAQLAISGSTYYGVPVTLYGTTRNGGQHLTNCGTIFSIKSDGSDYQILHTFAGGTGGAYPVTRLLISGNVLYGTTTNTVFRINTDGSGFATLSSSISGASELVLSLSGMTLYGTATGGTNNLGMVFSINTDGSGFKDLYAFQNNGTDGAYPNAGLDLWTNAVYSVPPLLNPPLGVLYGTTKSGGTYGNGTVFSINSDGSNYQILHHFGDRQYDGIQPQAGMILRPQTGGQGYDTLYGTTLGGGTNGLGTVFSVATDGSFYYNLYDFSGPDGIGPGGKLALLASPEFVNPHPTLMGTTTAGGAYGKGTIFTLNAVTAADVFPSFYYNLNGTTEGGSTGAGLTMDIGDHSDSVLSLDTTLNVSDPSGIDASIAIDNAAQLYVNGNFVTNYYTDAQAEWLPAVALQPFLHAGANDIRVIIEGDTGPDNQGNPLDNNDYFDLIITNASTSVTYTLPPPTGLRAVPGNQEVTLTWDPVNGATGYNVYRSIVSGGSYVLVSASAPTTAQTTYTDTGLVNGTTYYYVVQAVGVCQNSTYSTEAYAIPGPVLVGFWPANEGNGNVLHDVVGGDNGTIYNDSWGTGVSGHGLGAYALSFNGSSTYVSIPSSTALDFGTGAFSIGFWFNGQISGNTYPAILTDNPGDWESGCFALRFGNQGNSFLSAHWYPTDYILESGTLNPGSWHYAVFTRDGANISLYIDAVLTETATVSASAPIDLGDGGAMLLGGNAWDGSTSYYLGLMEDLQIYAGALSLSQIETLYGLPPNTPPQITVQPQSQTVSAGSAVTFSVAATGAQSYQWQFNGVPIPGATGTTYTISSVAPGNAGNYSVVVSNPNGSVNSAAAALSLTAANAALVGYWSFNEGSGTVAHDTVNGNNGTIYNGAWVSGLSGADLDFDGTSTYVAIPESANLNFGTGACSICFRFNGELDGNTYPAILTDNPGNWESGCFALRFGNLGYQGLSVHWYPTDYILESGTLNSGTWHQAVFVRNGTTISLYIDSVLVQTASVSASSTIDLGDGGYMYLGGNAWDGPTSYFEGSLAQLQIYQGALTQTQITSLYDEYAPPTITTQPLSQTVSAGSAVTFSVTSPLAQTYQWQFNGQNISGATSSTYTISSVAAGNAGNYSVVVSNPGGSVNSAAAALSLTAANAALVGYWSFNEGSGSVVHDTVNGNNGTIYNGVWDSGIAGEDLDFDGSSTYVAIPESANLNFGTGACSICFWFNGELDGNTYPAILTDNPGNWESGCFALRFGNEGNSFLSVHWYPTDYILESGTLNSGTWHQAVFVRNGTSISLYIDSTLVQTATVSASSTIDLGDGGYMYLGGNAWDGSTSYFEGSLEQLQIYQGALTQAQITSLFNTP